MKKREVKAKDKEEEKKQFNEPQIKRGGILFMSKELILPKHTK